MRNANSMTKVKCIPKIRVLNKTSTMYQKLLMRNGSTKGVAAMDSCFALIRARQHCKGKHNGDAKSFHSSPYIK